MTAISWKSGISGAWGNAADWSGGVVPGAGDSVTINAAGTYTVTIGAGLSYSVGTLSLNAAGATLDDLGTLTLGSTFTVSAGNFILDTGGMLSGGTLRITPTTGLVTYNGGTLSHVSVQGTMDLSAASAAVTEIGGIAFAGATGTGAGAVKLTGAGSSLAQTGSGTLNSAIITMGNGTTADTLSVLDSAGAGILTLGSALALNYGTGLSVLQDTGGTGDGITNQGTIASSGTGASALSIAGNAFTNAGTVNEVSSSVIGTSSVTSLTVSSALAITDAMVVNSGTLLVGPTAAAATGAAAKAYTALATDSLSIGGTLFTNNALLSLSANATTTGISAATATGTLNITSNSFTNVGTLSLAASAGTSSTGTAATGAATASSTAIISSASFINSGSILISGTTSSSASKPGSLRATDNLTITSANFTNTGLISISGSSTRSTLKIGANAVSATGTTPAMAATNWTNTGTITATTGTVNLFGNFTLGTFNHAGATVLIGGYDNNTGNTLTVGGSAGVITAGNGLSNTTPAEILPGGYITGGTIIDQGLGLINNYDTLDGVTYQGTLAVDQAGTNVTLVDGITLEGLGGTGSGAITIGGNITGTSASYVNTYLYTYGNTTLNNATVTMGSNNTTHTAKGVATIVNNSSYIDAAETTNAGGTLVPGVLTFGTGLLLTEYATANYIQIANQALDGTAVWTTTPYAAGDAITNNGTFLLNSATGTMDVQAQNFTNNGTISLSNGGTFEIDTYNQAVNAGTMTANGGALLIDVNATGPAGVQTEIATASGGTATITTYQTNNFTNSGTILATGTEIELGGTLTAGWLAHFSATGAQTYLQQYAYAHDAGAVLQSGAGTSGAANQLVLGGTIIGGTIDDSGNGLVAAGGTLDGVTYAGNLDPISEATYKYNYVDIKDGITLTGANGSGAGTVTLTNGVGLFGLGNTTLDNAGITLGAGVVLGEAANSHGTFTLGGAATLNETGVSARLQSGTGTGDAFTNSGSIYLAGAGATLSITGNAFDNVGALVITGAMVADAATTTVNSGQISLQGGTLAASGLTNATGIGGFGLIEAGAAGGTLTNTGLIYAAGALTIAQGVSGAGTLAEAYGTLTLGGAATGGTLLFEQAGTIVLDQAGLVQDSISGLMAGDVLDLAGFSASSSQLAGGSLTVSASGGGTLTYQTGGTAGLTVGTSSDGHGGTAIEVFNLASASVSPSLVVFGNVHVGDSLATTLSVTNTAPGLLSETLDASFGGFTGGVTGGGSFTGLTAGGTDSTDLVLGLNTGSSGAISGTAEITLFSDGQGVDGNGATIIGTQTVQATGAAYAYAAPTQVPATINLGATRVGGSLAGSFSLGDGTVQNAYQESLVYTLGGGTGSAGGTIVSGASTSIGVSLATGTSGTITSSGTVGLVSTGVGTSGLADTALGSDTLTVTGKVFQTAAAGLSAHTIAFGNVHVGDAASQSLSVTNTATGALVDHLLVAASGNGSGFSGMGSLNLTSNASGSFTVGLNTASAGSYAGNLALGLTSHDLTLADLSLGTQTVSLTGAVYAYAAPILGTAALDLGAVRAGGALSGTLALSNGGAASAYQESLVYTLNGVASASGTIASGGSTSIGVSLATGTSGTITAGGTLGLVSTGLGTSGLADTTLGSDAVSVTGTVYQTATATLSANAISFGNVHVGDTASTTLGIGNTATGALVDQLQAASSASGTGFSGGGSLSLASGASGSLTVGLSTASAGAFSGSLAVALASHDSQLADLSLGTQTVALSGTVYAYAAPTQVPAIVDLGAVRVGGSLAGSFTLGDGASQSAYQESLVYNLAGTVGSGAGTIVSGGSTSIGVSLATGMSGTITAGGTLGLVSTGVGTSGLADTNLGTDTVSVTGTVYQTAAASLSTQTIDFGSVHVGVSATESIGVTNTATGALVDSLVLSSGLSGIGFSGGGSLSLAGGTAGMLSIMLDSAGTGTQGGSLALGLSSQDGVLANLSLGTQTVLLTGTAYAYAAPQLSSNSITLSQAVRVGGTLSGTLSLSDGTAQNAYQENLLYALNGNAGSGNGTIASGASAMLGLALDTGKSGVITTNGTLGLTSTGVGSSGLADTSLGNQGVSVTGTVYQTASAHLATRVVSFGITHVGQMETATLVVGNNATGALVDELMASLSGFSGPFSAGSSGVTITSMQNGTLTVDFLSQSAGAFSGNSSLSLASYDAALGSLGLTGATISLSGTVDNYAQASLGAVGGAGTFTLSGNNATLNFGTVMIGGGSVGETLSITNSAAGTADLLSGSFAFSGMKSAFSNTNFGTFSGLSAGQAFSQLGIGFPAGTQSGTYTEMIVLTPVGYNASGYTGALAPETITVTGSVIGSYTLTTGTDNISAGSGDDFLYAASNTLSSGDIINGHAGNNTLVLTGAGAFNLSLPGTLVGITTLQATELTSGEQTVTLRNGTASQIDVASVSGGSISIMGATNTDTIHLGDGADRIVLGAASETVFGGSGTDTYTVNAQTIGAAIHAGPGISLLDVTGGGNVTMGSSLSGSFASVTLLGNATNFIANGQHGLEIVAAGSGDIVRVGDASQTVQAQGGAAVHVLATAAEAGVAISNVGTGSVLEITTGGTATLSSADTGLTVKLDKGSTLMLGTMGFVTAIGSKGADTITANGANQTLTGGLGADVLIGNSGGHDLFSDTIKGLNADSIVNFGSVGDVIDITNLGTLSHATFTSSGGSLTTAHLTGSGGSLTFKIDGSFTSSGFSVTSDGHGGEMITYH